MIKDIDKQVAEWHENNEPAKIIELLESLPQDALTFERMGWLGRAYNNLAINEKNPEHFETALRVLGSVRSEEAEKDELWNHRMGFTLYHLDREGEAIEYLRRTLEGDPYESLRTDTEEMLNSCYECLAYPRYEKGYFAERVDKAWKAFAENESELRRLIDGGAPFEQLHEIVTRCLEPAFPALAFVIGTQDYHVIFSAEGNWMLYFLFVYFLRRMPESVRKHWKFTIGREANPELSVDFGEGRISAEEVLVRPIPDDGGDSVSLEVYHPLVACEQESPSWWRAEVLVDHTIGELVNTEFVSQITALETAPEDTADFMPLTALRDYLEKRYAELPTWENAEALIQGSMDYKFKKVENPDPEDLRYDVLYGSTRVPRLIGQFAQGESYIEDLLHSYGAVGGFFGFDVPGLADMNEDERAAAVEASCSALEAYIRAETDSDCVDFTGRAVGTHHVYVDFIAYDLHSVTGAAFNYFNFEKTDVPFATFQVFRRDIAWFNFLKKDD